MPSPPDPAIPPHAPRPDFAVEEELRRLLTNAHIQFRRGQTADAEKIVQEVLARQPGDAAAHELLGDIRIARGDFDGAQAAFKAALEHEPGRATAEARLARATLRQSEQVRKHALGVSYAGGDAPMIRAGGDTRQRAGVLAFCSFLLPGLGQIVSGEYVKGAILAVISLLGLLLFSLLPATRDFLHLFGAHRPGQGAASPGFLFWLLLLVLTAVWVYAIADAARAAQPSQ